MNEVENRFNNKRLRVYQTGNGSDSKMNIMKRLSEFKGKRRTVRRESTNNNSISSDEFDTSNDDHDDKRQKFSIDDLECPLLDMDEKNKDSAKSGDKKKKKPAAKNLPEEIQLQQVLDDDLIEATSHQSSILKRFSSEEPINGIEDNSYTKTFANDDTKETYTENYNLPKILYFDELLTKTKPYFGVVNKILKGKVASPYYVEAKKVFKKSQKPLLSTEELRHIDLSKFQAGYYGLKRQLRLGQEIYTNFEDRLLLNKSSTLRWWGALDFAQYVLAPELLLHLCIEEMDLNKPDRSQDDDGAKQKAYDIFKNTIQYGSTVADASPLEEWESHI